MTVRRRLLTSNAGRGAGAGPRPDQRRLDPIEVAASRAHWFAQPVSPERTRALVKIHKQFLSIANRVGAQP